MATRKPSRVREATPKWSGGSRLWRASPGSRRADALLLDTHVWLWTLDGVSGSMSAAAMAMVQRAADERRLYVSDVSFWEIALKVSKGKLDLAIDPTVWLTRAAAAPGIQLVPVARDVFIQSPMLPAAPHGDPADRLLIAQSLLGGMSSLTCDRGIIDYAERQPGIPVCDARA